MPVSIDPDQQKNEETTKLRYITPVISERWQDTDKVLMEYYFTDGRISQYGSSWQAEKGGLFAPLSR